jgi:hypothetical protein
MKSFRGYLLILFVMVFLFRIRTPEPLMCDQDACKPDCPDASVTLETYGVFCEDRLNVPYIPTPVDGKWAFITLLEPDQKIVTGTFRRMLLSIDRYYPFKGDLVILHEGEVFTSLVKRILQQSTRRTIKFVNVEPHFRHNNERQKTCQTWGSLGYRLMCRLMSGPVYWLPELAQYDYLIRMDDDSTFTAPIQVNLVQELIRHHAVYAYAVDSNDIAECHTGAEDFLRRYKFGPERSRLPIGPNHFKFRNENLDWYSENELDVMNCNFEVLDLAYFRHPHYKQYWEAVNKANLFIASRLGDHQVKTMYLSLLEPPDRILCFADLPYEHPWMRRCHEGTARTHSVKILVTNSF